MNHINSFEGNLIKIVVEHWIQINLFESVDRKLKDSLKPLLEGFLKLKINNVSFDSSPELVDRNTLSGIIEFTDHLDKEKSIEFTANARKVEIHEKED